MTTTEQTAFKKWLKGIPYEISFWKSYYSHKKSLAELDSWSDYGKECRLDNFDIMSFISTCPSEPLLVDLGCALSYTFGTDFGSLPVRIDRVDPLAVFYNRILDKYAPARPRIRFGMIENICAVYSPYSVDLIHVRNALDHCSDPMSGIRQCLVCLRKGGVLYLNHHCNEALREGYRGFHQYNINIENGRLIIWNRTERIDVGESLAGLAELQCSITDSGMVVAVLTKISESDSDSTERDVAVERLNEMFTMMMTEVNSFRFCTGYQWARIVSSVVHPLMRRIPRKLVERIKKMIS